MLRSKQKPRNPSAVSKQIAKAMIMYIEMKAEYLPEKGVWQIMKKLKHIQQETGLNKDAMKTICGTYPYLLIPWQVEKWSYSKSTTWRFWKVDKRNRKIKSSNNGTRIRSGDGKCEGNPKPTMGTVPEDKQVLC